MKKAMTIYQCAAIGSAETDLRRMRTAIEESKDVDATQCLAHHHNSGGDHGPLIASYAEEIPVPFEKSESAYFVGKTGTEVNVLGRIQNEPSFSLRCVRMNAIREGRRDTES
jgi:hypothetical protein